jgi:hypothetical protein
MGTFRMFAFVAGTGTAAGSRATDDMPSGPDRNLDDQPASLWGLVKEPPPGAHLATSRRGYTHHGVYAGLGRVVHYAGISGLWQCGPVEEVSMAQFVNGHPVRIVEHFEPHYSPEEIVRRARSRIGENDYRLLTNNCEHFCNWCFTGVGRSAQAERFLQLPLRLLGSLFHA